MAAHRIMSPPGNKPPSDDDRLESWKEVAAYLKHSERTVRRWESAEGLPVHRHRHEQRGSVYAFRSELDAWRTQRSQRSPVFQSAATIETPARGRRVFWSLLSLFGVALVLLGFWMRPREKPDPIPVPITTYQGNELDPAFSPDGSQIAFTWNGSQQDNYDIYVRPLAQDRPVRLTWDPAEEFNPVWSPDGRTLAFLRKLSQNEMQVLAISASGGPARPLVRFFFQQQPKFRTRFLAWRAGSRQLAVAGRNSPQEPYALWAIEDHGSKFRLTAPPGVENMLGDLNPAYAPDGRSLLFTRGRSKFTSELHLLPLSADGTPEGDPKPLAQGIIGANAPVWLNDGRIVFHRFLQGEGLWMLRVPENRPARVGFAASPAEMPAFSIHGSRLAYAAGGLDFNIWSVELAAPDRVAGSPKRAVVSTQIESAPAVSPDGRVLAFASTRSGKYAIWLSGMNGQHAVQLTTLPQRSAHDPRWSPDGNWLIFESRKEGRSDVFAIRPDGSSVRQLTTDPADDLAVNWSRDGAWVYFSSNRGGRWDVWKTHWETGREVRVTTSGGLSPTESPNGRYLYYVKVEPWCCFLWRAPVNGGPEELVLSRFPVAAYRGFVALDDAVYFISKNEGSGENALFLLKPSSGAVTRITSLGNGFIAYPGITPDRRRILYAVAEEKGYDIMAVENFR
jgi:Tol biopolymer transport system component